MTPLRIIQEIQRNQWAITIPALRAILSVVDEDKLTADDYRFFHSLEQEKRDELKASEVFGTYEKDTYYTYINGNVGYLYIDGPIIPRATIFSHVSGMVSLDRLTTEFKSLEQRNSIDTIALIVDSPGGVVTGVSDFASLVKASTKQTYAFTWFAASAAYWIASATDKIVSPQAGIVGSIGTILSLTDYTEAEQKRGIKRIDIVSSQSPNKRPDPNTAEGKRVLQQLVDDISDVFISDVATNRHVTVDDVVNNFGGGATVVAHRALPVVMIDEISDAETFSKSLVNRSNYFSIAVGNAALTAEDNMDPKNAPKAENNDTAVKAARDDGMKKERQRIQSIEALGAKFKNSHPSVRKAALEAIDAHKYDDGATEATVAIHVAEAVANAKVEAVDSHGAEMRNAANVASFVGQATTGDDGSNEASESKVRVEGLCAARKERLRKVGM